MKKLCLTTVFCFILIQAPAIYAGYDVPKNVRIPKISAWMVAKHLKQSKVLLIDSHSRERYSKRHILGATNVPYDEIERLKIRLPKKM